VGKLDNNQKKFLNKVIELVAVHVGRKNAQNLVYNSSFYKTLFNDPVFVMYYEPDDWAKEIIQKSKVAI